MQGPYKVVTLCGSTRFKDAFLETQKKLTLKGYIVLSVGLFGHSGDPEAFSGETKTMLDDMHKHKIDMSDEIFVIDVGGYIGDSTRSEIRYAELIGKKVNYLYKLDREEIEDRILGILEKHNVGRHEDEGTVPAVDEITQLILNRRIDSI